MKHIQSHKNYKNGCNMVLDLVKISFSNISRKILMKLKLEILHFHIYYISLKVYSMKSLIARKIKYLYFS